MSEHGGESAGSLRARIGAGFDERREPVALAVALLALLLVWRGWRNGTHSGVEVAAGMLLVARGIALGRPVLRSHLVASLAFIAVAGAAHASGHPVVSWIAAVTAGAVAALPRRAPDPASAHDRRHVWLLVDRSAGDTLAPFALRTDKSYVFTEDRAAAVAYRVRFGTAIASGDPVGDPAAREAAIAAFLRHADASGWRAAVLGAGEVSVNLWRREGLRALPIGRDVAVTVDSWSLDGRQFRNLRQAVQRTRNAGVTTDIVPERGLPADLRDELVAVMRAAGKEQARGFAMILDHVLDGTHPGTFIAYARDANGRVVAFQRYATADGGRDLSLDVPWRVPGAPNGVDERLIADMVDWASARRAQSVSVAFAPFPEIFAATHRSVLGAVAYRGVHLFDRFIKLESLYRFVRKFHAFGQQRFIALRPTQVLWVAAAALALEFGATKRHR